MGIKTERVKTMGIIDIFFMWLVLVIIFGLGIYVGYELNLKFYENKEIICTPTVCVCEVQNENEKKIDDIWDSIDD